MRYWKYSGLPSLSDELIEFLEFMAKRVSRSLNKVDYRELCKVFSSDFILSSSEYEDEVPFNIKKA